ncbi:MAG TPA: iron donor protein CyaY [Ectothiorhodospiraceae bacterium]|nr:iron donor protein CyaY [Ectothiorhodospiraceae bacterium]
MNESEFHQQVDAILLNIEETIDDSGADLDYENSAGILTLILDNESQIIINRQTPLKQLWLAARSGGYHFDWSDEAGGWVRDSDGTGFIEMLNKALIDQGGEALEL